VRADSPTDEDLQALLHKIITRLMKLLTRRGVLIEEEGESGYLALESLSKVEMRNALALICIAHIQADGPDSMPCPCGRCLGAVLAGLTAGKKALPRIGAQPIGQLHQTGKQMRESKRVGQLGDPLKACGYSKRIAAPMAATESAGS